MVMSGLAMKSPELTFGQDKAMAYVDPLDT